MLLAEPNVLILDEPTNDLDTDMLTAMEDVLDSWPGTLIVVSHDRYLIERVTDRQFAVLGGHLRHLPGGVDEYLRLAAANPPVLAAASGDLHGSGSITRAAADTSPGSGASPDGPDLRSGAPAVSGADRRTLEKQVASLDRRLAKLAAQIRSDHDALADFDQSDYAGVGALSESLRAREAERDALELEWLEAAERLEA